MVRSRPVIRFGTYPTPLQPLEIFSRPGTSLWIKRDDQTNPHYGGNKIRKLERLLSDAKDRNAKFIVTVGAAGSHHVLATGILAKSIGIRVEAVVVPQLRTDQVVENLRADVAQSIRLLPASSYAEAALLIAGRICRGAYYIPAGGSNPTGTMGFVDAAKELAMQVRAGEAPEPDLIVVALGSGGTAAGLLAGLATTGMRTRVLAVTVAQPPWFVECAARSLARRCMPGRARIDLSTRLEHDRRYLGRGYGYPTLRGKQAIDDAGKAGIILDHTYTGKAFAAALDRVAEGKYKTILYWHTLSSRSMDPLLIDAPSESELDPKVRALVRDEG
jgi:1-aminocyclopropane-1-carboxylate deaminase/D-cysteine desulfhydrase-like pyridoxal-dependent ACC family enzyme